MEIEYQQQTSRPYELSAREAAILVAEARHIVIVGRHDQAPSAVIRTFNALIRCYGNFLSLMVVVPIYAPEIQRPNIQHIASTAVYHRRPGQRVFPQLIFGFLRDTPENRRVVDVIARAAGATCSSTIEQFNVRGPIIVLGGDDEEIFQGAMLVTDNLRKLCAGGVDDLTVQ
jgi:hypothetical protein